MLLRIWAKLHFKLYINLGKHFRYLSVMRENSLTERNETDTSPLTERKRVHRPNDFFV